MSQPLCFWKNLNQKSLKPPGYYTLTTAYRCGSVCSTNPPSQCSLERGSLIERDSFCCVGGVDRSQALLLTTFDLIRHHPPAILYRNVCQALAAHYMSCDAVAAAFYLAEAQAVTFRHQALTNIERKVR